MSYRNDGDAYYGRQESPGYIEYRGRLASPKFEPLYGGRYQSEPPNRGDDEQPEGRRSVHVLRDQKYRYRAREIRDPFDQLGRVTRSTNQRDPSVDHPNYQNQAPHPSFDQFKVHRDGASYYDDRATATTAAVASACYNRRESDVPSMIESENSSVENAWDEDRWNGKSAAAPVLNSCRLYSEDLSKDDDLNANDKKPAAFGSRLPATRLPVTKVAFRNTKDSIMNSIEVLPGQFLRLRGAEETWRAITSDFYIPCACDCCSLTLFCIQDACFVLCPVCRVISPMEGIAFEGYEGGVGLGFTMEDLKCQEDLEWERRVTTWTIN